MSTYRIKISGKTFEVKVGSIKDGVAQVSVDGVPYEALIEAEEPQMIQSPVRPAAVPSKQGPAAPKAAPDMPQTPASGRAVKAPLPGTILNVSVAPGQSVRRGERIAVLEAMKMENDILCPADGTIKSVGVSKGDSVLEGAVIAVIE